MIYDIDLINSICKPFGYSARNSNWTIYISKEYDEHNEEEVNDSWYKPSIFCKVLNEFDEHEPGEFIVDRFAISFSGYGTLEDIESEEKVIEYILASRNLVTLLNAYVDVCNISHGINKEEYKSE